MLCWQWTDADKKQADLPRLKGMVVKMKKVIVVSKTHLDLGFTDYAEKVRQKYLNEFIPKAVSIANALNADGTKRFVWTTGSWLLREALENASE